MFTRVLVTYSCFCSLLLLLLPSAIQQTHCISVIIMSVFENSSCPAGYYSASNSSAEGSNGGGCTPCTNCAPGFGVADECSGSSNTNCEQCGGRTFSYLLENSSQRICKPCKDCGPSRTEVTQCSMYRDSVCGLCKREFFLFVSSTGERSCLPCSPCPEDFVATHYYECDIAGLPVTQQCFPGYENSTEAATTLTDIASQSEQSTTASAASTTFWLDKGGFISQATFSIVTVVKPLPTAVGISITTVFITLTVLALVLISLGSWCFLRGRCSVGGGRRQLCPSCSNCCEVRVYSQRRWLCWKCRKTVVEASTGEELDSIADEERCDASSLSESFDPS